MAAAAATEQQSDSQRCHKYKILKKSDVEISWRHEVEVYAKHRWLYDW